MNKIAVFTKSQVSGKVKTRLVNVNENDTLSTIDKNTDAVLKIKTKSRKKNNIFIDDNKALKIHTAFLKDTILKIKNMPDTEKYIYFHLMNKNNKDISKDLYLLLEKEFKICLQNGRNLGERLQNAFSDLITKDSDRALIIGSDSPTLPPEFLTNAFNILENNDIVIGPAFDGGYYLIGMKGAVFNVFNDIRWGSDEVLEKTVYKIKKKKLKLGILPPWYDIDREDDIYFLKNHLNLLNYSKNIVPEYTFNIL